MSILCELWAFMRVRKKYWLAPILFMLHGLLGGLDHPSTGGSAVAPFIHAVLKPCGSSASPRSITTAPPRFVVDGRIVAAAQEERFTRKKQDARFPAHADRVLPARGGMHARRRRLCGVLREAVPEVRAAARRPMWASRRAAFSHSRWRSRSGCARSCSRRTSSVASCRSVRARLRLADNAAAVHRAPHEPCGERVLSPRRSRRPPCSRMDGVGEWCTTSVGGRPRQGAHDR